MDARFYTSHEVAALVQVSPSAVLRWIDQGLLSAFRTPGGHRRVRSLELVAFLRGHAMPVPRELSAQVRLLVIDDEARFLSSLGTVLSRAEPRVAVELVDNPIEGLLRVGLTRPDVVLLDAFMPGMDGLEVCRRLKASKETAHIAVLAMSGRPSLELEQAFDAAGAASFLRKPLTVAQVLDALRRLGLVEAPRSVA